MTTTNDIINACATAWEITPEQVLGKDRHRQCANARHYARWMMYGHLGLPCTRIAEIFNCTHAAVLHSYEVATQWQEFTFFSPEQERALQAEEIINTKTKQAI